LGWIEDPQTLTAAIVFFAAAALTGLSRLVFDPRRASLGPAILIPVALFVVIGAPNIPPASPFDQIAILGFAGFVFGGFVELEGFHHWPRRGLIIVAPMVGLIWVIARAGEFDLTIADRNFVVFIFVGVLIAGVRTSRGKGSGLTAPTLLVAAAGGLFVLSWINGNFDLAKISAVIGMSIGGFFAWNWPTYRYPPGAALVAGAATSLAAVAGILVLDGRVSGTSVAILGLIFFSDWLAGFVSFGGGQVGRAMRPLLVIAVAAGIVAVAATVSA
jgi:hypothetical protein